MAHATPTETPNPNAMKFTLDITLPEMINAPSPAAATGQPLAETLFGIDGVVGVFATADFVTISKRPDAPWDAIVAATVEVLRTAL